MSWAKPKAWTECHEEVTRDGELQPCDKTPVVALRSDESEGHALDSPSGWYPVCTKHVRAPMVDLWVAFDWASGNDRDGGPA